MAEHESGNGGQQPPTDNGTRPGPVARVLLLPVRLYRKVISPILPPTCRFYPSCSAYAVEALTVHGAVKGTGLTVWRLLRCAPWHKGGLDPVPPASRERRSLRRRVGRIRSRGASRPPGEE